VIERINTQDMMDPVSDSDQQGQMHNVSLTNTTQQPSLTV